MRISDWSSDVCSSDLDAKGLPDDAEPHEGLINKWPFDAEKKTYPYWDGLVGGTVDAVFDRTETIEGMDTYVYRVEIADAEIEIDERSEESRVGKEGVSTCRSRR